MKAYFPASTCEDGCKYLQGRLQVLAGTVAGTCGDGCRYLQERLQVLAWRMQCTARTDAVHCRKGCSALRLRGAKLVPKSSVLLWMREKGGKNQRTGALLLPRKISTEPSSCPSHQCSSLNNICHQMKYVYEHVWVIIPGE